MDERLVRFACEKLGFPIHEQRAKVTKETFQKTHVCHANGKFHLWARARDSWDVKAFDLRSWELMGLGDQDLDINWSLDVTKNGHAVRMQGAKVSSEDLEDPTIPLTFWNCWYLKETGEKA